MCKGRLIDQMIHSVGLARDVAEMKEIVFLVRRGPRPFATRTLIDAEMTHTTSLQGGEDLSALSTVESAARTDQSCSFFTAASLGMAAKRHMLSATSQGEPEGSGS